ncbi:MAG TPA: DUF1579 family protein [Acidimicrobiia bacterium]|nr:DUF1579 family protein [Acidimicrobiia bacterium]
MKTADVLTQIPHPREAGAEMAAIRPFHRDGTWTGVIHPGGMGPGTPLQLAHGRASHHWIQDGRWVVGDYEQDQLLEDGTYVLKWELHWVCGWDPLAGEYKATIADNYGRASVLHGRVDGRRMIFESIGDQPPRLRLIWELTPEGNILWTNEMSLDGAAWMLVEDYEIKPSD